MSDLLPDKVKTDNILTAHNAIRDSINSGEIASRSLSEMQAETDSNFHLVIVNDRFTGKYTLELWYGSAHVGILRTFSQ
jgi:hypothetical protein